MNIFVFFSFLRHFPIFSPILPIFSFSDPRRYFAVADVGNTVFYLWFIIYIHNSFQFLINYSCCRLYESIRQIGLGRG
jgi:hypothetical protein